MTGATNKVSVFVGGAFSKMPSLISSQQKVFNLLVAKNNIMEEVKDFLPESFIFTKPVGDQAIPALL